VDPGVSAGSARAIARDEGGRNVGELMAGVAVRESVTLAGRAERARLARVFVGGVLGPGHPRGGGELFGNSVRHSGSRAPGKTVTVAVRTGDGFVRVEVTDSSGPGVPELAPVARDAEGGRGLQLVTGLASRWGWRRCGGRTMTWFEIQALLQPMQHSAVPGKGLNSPDVEVPGS
jgi:hypothetical protein